MGEHEKALEYYHKDLEITIKVHGQSHRSVAVSHYNIACACSIAGMISEALASLGKAVAHGHTQKSEIESDSDFDSIRHHEQFQQILKRM